MLSLLGRPLLALGPADRHARDLGQQLQAFTLLQAPSPVNLPPDVLDMVRRFIESRAMTGT